MAQDPNRPLGSLAKVIRHSRRKIVAGFLLMIPAGATIYIAYRIFVMLDAVLPSFVSTVLPFLPSTWIPGVGVALLLILAYLLGLVAANYAGRRLLRGIDGLLGRVPLFNKVYQTLRQIVDAVAGNKKRIFEKVVLVQFPHTGAKTIGFLTSEVTGELSDHLGEKSVTVFVPTSPAPTQGFILIVPACDVTPLSMSAETALKIIMSAGAFSSSSNASLTPPEKNTQSSPNSSNSVFPTAAQPT